jgi:chemotaxis protein MotB
MIEIMRSFKGSIALLPGGIDPELGVELPIPVQSEISKGEAVPDESYRQSVETLRMQLRQAGAKEEFSVESFSEGLRITLNDTLLFDSGNAGIKHPSQIFLDIVANTIKKSSVKAVIIGHTDNQPIHTELYPSNWELSVMRAVNLLRYMKGQFHIPLERIQACGAGEFRPKNENSTPEDRSRNRRVEIMLLPLEESHG